MFLLNNIHDRSYRLEYPDMQGVAFDISEIQLNNRKNEDWNEIAVGSVFCVVKGTRTIDIFGRVLEKPAQMVADRTGGMAYVILGGRIARLHDPRDMTTILNRYGVSRPDRLPGNHFGNGVNVVDLGDKLDAMELRTHDNPKTIAELKRGG